VSTAVGYCWEHLCYTCDQFDLFVPSIRHVLQLKCCKAGVAVVNAMVQRDV
jgi:hypothetical protein